MSLASRVDEGVVTQDDTTINDGNDSLDAGYTSYMEDPDVRAGTIAVLRRADEILVANGRGSCAKRAVERTRRFKDDLNGTLVWHILVVGAVDAINLIVEQALVRELLVTEAVNATVLVG